MYDKEKVDAVILKWIKGFNKKIKNDSYKLTIKDITQEFSIEYNGEDLDAYQIMYHLGRLEEQGKIIVAINEDSPKYSEITTV
jgi:hypothetical protein